MKNQHLQRILRNEFSNHFMPFLWYCGESIPRVLETIQAIRDAGMMAFTLENRGGDWFCTERWWPVLEAVLAKAAELGMRVWILDDAHVATGSANESLGKEENARFRAKNLRVDIADVAGPLSGAMRVLSHTPKESLVRVVAVRRKEDGDGCLPETLDLTASVRDGLCMAELPRGLWRVVQVFTADPSMTGCFARYITMLSRDSCRHLIDEVHEKIYSRFSRYFGTVIAGFFTDEPGFGNCDGDYGPGFARIGPGDPRHLLAWEDDMAAELAAVLGMTEDEVMTTLPALWIDMETVSPRMRLAYMDIVTRRWKVNFTGQLGDWCRAHGVEYMGHNLEDEGAHFHMGFGCGHFFRSLSGQDFGGWDIVLGQIMPGYTTHQVYSGGVAVPRSSTFYEYTLGKLGTSLAHHTPRMKNRLMCEVMGAYGWAAGLAFMRALFNFCLVHGTNYYVPHTFSLEVPDAFTSIRPNEEPGVLKAPEGYSRFYMPPSFFACGFNPQFRGFKVLSGYVQRVSDLLSAGVHCSDVAVYYPAETAWMDEPGVDLDDVCCTLIRGGWDFELLSLDMLNGSAAVRDGRLWDNGESYGALVIPSARRMPAALVEKAVEFSCQGLPVIFAGDYPEDTEAATPSLPELRETCIQTSLETLADVLKGVCAPCLEIVTDEPELRRYMLRREDGTVVVLFFNNSLRTSEAVVMPPVEGASCLYEPWSNQLFAPDICKGGIRVKLPPQQLLAAIFGEDRETAAGLPDFLYGDVTPKEVPLVYDIYMKAIGDRDFKLYRKASRPVNLLLEDSAMTRLCAEFRYDAVLDCQKPEEVSYLDIPGSGDCAELILNGESCGIALGPCCRFDVRGRLKAGANALSILTADNPSYADRTGSLSTTFGEKLALLPHGFVGDIRLG